MRTAVYHPLKKNISKSKKNLLKKNREIFEMKNTTLHQNFAFFFFAVSKRLGTQKVISFGKNKIK